MALTERRAQIIGHLAGAGQDITAETALELLAEIARLRAAIRQAVDGAECDHGVYVLQLPEMLALREALEQDASTLHTNKSRPCI